MILSSIIARIPGWFDLEINQIERIAGLTNVNYRVTVNRDAHEIPELQQICADD